MTNTPDPQTTNDSVSIDADCSEAVAILVKSKRGTFLVDWSKHFDLDVAMAGTNFRDQGWEEPAHNGYFKFVGELVDHGEDGSRLLGGFIQCAVMEI